MSFTVRIPKNILTIPKGIKEGETIDWSNESLKEHVEGELIINVAHELNIVPRDIFKYLYVSLGDKLSEGDALAEKKGFMARKTITVPDTAEVRAINHVEGTVTLVIDKLVDVPFALKGVLAKKEKDCYVISLKQGFEIELLSALDKTVGGKCSYIEHSEDIAPAVCEKKIVITPLSSKIDEAKIAALDPIALVRNTSAYYHRELMYMHIAQKSEWKKLLEKKPSLCLYIEGQKTVYFYQ